MHNPSLDEYHQELQQAFFQQRDQELLEYLRCSSAITESADPLHALTGVDDPQVLESLQRAGITAESIAAFTLLPLVRVAWADGSVSDNEFNAIMKAAEDEGIHEGSVGQRLLHRWLEERPSERMLIAWRAYAQALGRELDDESWEAIKQSTLGRAFRVAEASGGLLGLGNRISDNERLALEDLGNAFAKPADLV
jgi:hypothetical protein